MKSFFTSVSILTIIPVPVQWTKNISSCSVYFALTGFLIGFLYYGAAWALKIIHVREEWAALVLLFLMIFITRGFHLDGLADMFDGFWGGRDKEHILIIMKDSSTGVFGVLSLILICLLKWTAIKFILHQNSLWIFISSVVISRFSMTLLSGFFSYARETGTGGIVINSTGLRHVVIAFIYTALFLFLLVGYGSFIIIWSGCLISTGIGIYSYFKIKGITGDVLGASSEITEGLLLAITPNLVLFLPDYFRLISEHLPVL